MQIDNKKLAQEWFDAGESDFRYAEVGLKEMNVFPQVASLSQQVAEKYLKGFLILSGKNPERVHDLPKLLDECVKLEPKLESLRDVCELLVGFYVEVRYPPDIPEYTKGEMFEAFNSARLVKETIELLSVS